MNEEYLKAIHAELAKKYGNDMDDYNTFKGNITTNSEYLTAVHTELKQQYGDDLDDLNVFETNIGFKKKSESGSKTPGLVQESGTSKTGSSTPTKTISQQPSPLIPKEKADPFTANIPVAQQPTAQKQPTEAVTPDMRMQQDPLLKNIVEPQDKDQFTSDEIDLMAGNFKFQQTQETLKKAGVQVDPNARVTPELQKKYKEIEVANNPVIQSGFKNQKDKEIIAGHEDVVSDYLSVLKEQNPGVYENIRSKSEQGALDENDKFDIVSQALSGKAQALGKDMDILDKRGEIDQFVEFKQAEANLAQIRKARQDYEAQMKEKGVTRSPEWKQAMDQYDQILEQEKEAVTSLNQFPADQITRIESKYGEYQQLAEKTKNLIFEFPEVVKKQQQQEEANIWAEQNPIKSSFRDSYFGITNLLMETGGEMVKFPMRIAGALSYGNTDKYTTADKAIDAVDDFVGNYLVAPTSNRSMIESKWKIKLDDGSEFLVSGSKEDGIKVYDQDENTLQVDENLKRELTAKLELQKEETGADDYVNIHRVAPMLTQQVANIAVLVFGGELAAGRFAALGNSAKLSQAAGLFTSSFVMTYDDYEKQALSAPLDKRLSPTQARNYALAAAAATSLAENISPNRLLLGEAKEKLGKELLEIFIKNQTKDSKSIAKLMWQGTKNHLAKSTSEVIPEVTQELSQLALDKGMNAAANFMLNREALETGTSIDEVGETIASTIGATFLVGQVGAVRATKKENNEALLYGAENIMKVHGALTNMYHGGQIDQITANAALKKAVEAQEALKLIPANLTPEQKAKVLPLVIEKSQMNKELEGKDPAFKALYKEQQKNIDAQIQQLLIGDVNPAFKNAKTTTAPKSTTQQGTDLATATAKPKPKPQPPTPSAPQPVKTDHPDSGKTISEMIGTKVEYQGVKGKLGRDQDGNIIVENQNEVVEIPVQKNDQLTLKEAELTPVSMPKIEFDEFGENMKVDGEDFKVESINTNTKGEVVSVTMTTADGRKITKRDPDFALQVDIERNKIETAEQLARRNKPEDVEVIHNEIAAASGGAVKLDDVKVVDGILSNNYDETIDGIFDKAKTKLTAEEVAKGRQWAENAITQLESLDQTPYTKKVIENLYGLLETLEDTKHGKEQIAAAKAAVKTQGNVQQPATGTTGGSTQENKPKTEEVDEKGSQKQGKQQPKAKAENGTDQQKGQAPGKSGSEKNVLGKAPKGYEYKDGKLVKKENRLLKSMKRYFDIDPATPAHAVMRYFATGGRIDYKDAMDQTGLGNKDLLGKTKNGAPTVDRLVDDYAREFDLDGDVDGNLRNLVIEILSGKTNVFEELKALYPTQEELNAKEQELLESLQANLTEEELDILNREAIAREAFEAIEEIDAMNITDDQAWDILNSIFLNYMDEDMNVNWNKLEEDFNGFDPQFLNLSEELFNDLKQIISNEKARINENQQGESGRSGQDGSQNNGNQGNNQKTPTGEEVNLTPDQKAALAEVDEKIANIDKKIAETQAEKEAKEKSLKKKQQKNDLFGGAGKVKKTKGGIVRPVIDLGVNLDNENIEKVLAGFDKEIAALEVQKEKLEKEREAILKPQDAKTGDLNFDFNQLFENQPPVDEQVVIDEEREEAYQKSKFDKKWAATYKEARKKLIDQYNQAKSEKARQEGKVIKPSGGKVVEVGDELTGKDVSVDAINKKRRQDAINNAQSEMDSAINDLKSLGLTKDEISAITEEVTSEINDYSFELFENEGEWKVSNKAYKGRDIANFVFSLLDKNSLKEYNKLRDFISYGTKEQAEKQLNLFIEFENKHLQVFKEAKTLIDKISVDEVKPETPPTGDKQGFARNQDKIDDLLNDIDNILDDLDLGGLNTGINPELVAATFKVAYKLVLAGYYKLQDIASYLVQKGAQKLLPYLKDAYRKIKSLPELTTEVKTSLDNEKTINETDIEGLIQKGEGKPAESGSAATGANRGNGINRRPPIRIANEQDLPTPAKEYVVDGRYDIDEHQRLGVNLALNRFDNGRAFLLADGAGVGKTREILVVAEEQAKKTGKKVLIVSLPGALKDSFPKDAKALGIDLSRFEMGTYDDLRTGKIGKGDYGLVIYDESHNLKNSGSERSIAARKVKSDNAMYASATPMDKPIHAIYFIAEITNKTTEQVEEELGIEIVFGEGKGGEVVPYANLKVSFDTYLERLIDMRNGAIKNGAMIRREYPFFGEIEDVDENMPPALKPVVQTIEERHQYRIDNAIDIINFTRQLRNLPPLDEDSPEGKEQVRKFKKRENEAKLKNIHVISEPAKAEIIFNNAIQDLQDGKSVIIVGSYVNPIDIEIGSPRSKKYFAMKGVVPLSKILEEKFKEAGFEVAKILGGNTKGSYTTEQDKFNSGKARVLLMTAKSGGTGINLDDVEGSRPRVMYQATVDYSGDTYEQVLGRVSRRNTQSPATIKNIFFNNNFSDMSRRTASSAKRSIIKGIVSGEKDLDADRIEGNKSELEKENPAPRQQAKKTKQLSHGDRMYNTILEKERAKIDQKELVLFELQAGQESLESAASSKNALAKQFLGDIGGRVRSEQEAVQKATAEVVETPQNAAVLKELFDEGLIFEVKSDKDTKKFALNDKGKKFIKNFDTNPETTKQIRRINFAQVIADNLPKKDVITEQDLDDAVNEIKAETSDPVIQAEVDEARKLFSDILSDPAPEIAAKGEVEKAVVEVMTEKAIIVTGNSFAIKDALKAAGGKFIKGKKTGWMFPATKRAEVEAIVANADYTPSPDKITKLKEKQEQNWKDFRKGMGMNMGIPLHQIPTMIRIGLNYMQQGIVHFETWSKEMYNDLKTNGVQFDKADPDFQKDMVSIYNQAKAQLHQNLTPQQARKKWRDEQLKSEKEYREIKRTTWQKFKQEFMRKMVDVSGNLKEMLKNEGAVTVIEKKDLISGSSAKAKVLYTDYAKKIFKGLKKKEERVLAEIISIHRVMELDKIFDRDGKPRLMHPGGHTKESAEMALQELRNENPELYAKLEQRANEYWKAMRDMLDAKYAAGLLGDTAYQKLQEYIYYSPREFLQYLDPVAHIVVGGKLISQTDSGIEALKQGSEESALNDPRTLLQHTIFRTQMQIARNEAAKELHKFSVQNPNNSVVQAQAIVDNSFEKIVREAIDKIEAKAGAFATPLQKQQIRDKILKTLTDKQVALLEAKLGVPLTPVEIKQVEDGIRQGEPIYQDTPKPGYSVISAMKDGIRYKMFMPDQYAREWIERDKDISSWLAGVLSWGLGGRILRFTATGANPAFAFANFPRDIALILGATNTYSKHFPVAIAQIAGDVATVMKDAFTRSGRYERYIMEGGGMEFLTQQGRLFRVNPLSDHNIVVKSFNGLVNILGYINETSEILTRLALREREIKKQSAAFEKQHGVKPSGSELAKIEQNATWQARYYLDFSQGGSVAKAIDSFIPYFNASIQGTRTVVRYAKSDPKTFAYKMAQLGMVAGGLALRNVLHAGWDDIDDDIKSQNFIIMLPWKTKNKNGQEIYSYWTIPKSHEQRIFAGIFEGMVELWSRGKMPYHKLWVDIQGSIPKIPFYGDKPPVIEAIHTYYSNYDHYREEQIWKSRTPIHPYAEFNQYTPEFYKAFGQETADLFGPENSVSPARFKVALSKVVAQADNNMFSVIGGKTYGIIKDALSEEDQGELDKHFFDHAKEVLGPVSYKYLKETRPKLKDEVEKMNLDENTNRKMQRDKIKEIVQSDKPKKEKIAEYNKWVVTQPKVDRKRLLDAFNTTTKKQGVDFWYVDLQLASTPEIAAKEFFRKYQDADQEKRKEMVSTANKLKITTDRFIKEFKLLKKINK